MRRSIAALAALIMLATAAGRAAAQAQTDLRITFVGDIMGHDVNYRMDDFHDIYRGVKDIFLSDDLTFANLEFPLDPTRPPSGYPYFNGTRKYLAAAVDSGVDLFSTANNHAFDGGVEGIFQTARALERALSGAPRPVVWSGTRGNPARPFAPESFVLKGVRIGFLAVAQFLNEKDGGRYVHVVDYADARQAQELVSYVHRISPLYDLFIVSYHGDREYVQTPSPRKKAFFRELLQAGAHIVVGHHPHVVQEYETMDIGGARRVAMYSMGNFISGMTWMLSPSQLQGALAATGESYMLQVSVRCSPGGCSVTGTDPIPIANYVDERRQVVVALMAQLADGSIPVSREWRVYYGERLALMRLFLAQAAAGPRP